MKRLAFSLAALLTMGSSACAQKSKTPNNDNRKTLVAYFSATGTTANAAKQLAKGLNADTYEIKPATPYTDADLDWRNKQSRSSVEMSNKSFRPTIGKKFDKMDNYNIIFVGFPIWWYTAPTIINTFMESYNFEGKTVIPFATSGGSTVDKAYQELKAAYPKAKWKPGRLLNSEDDITKWLNDLNK